MKKTKKKQTIGIMRVFSEDEKVVRKFQEEKSQLCPMLFSMMKQCEDQKYSLDFERDQAFIT